MSTTGLRMNPDKVKNVQGLHYPNSKTKVRSILGMVGYYRNFIPNFAGIPSPLFKTLKDDFGILFRFFFIRVTKEEKKLSRQENLKINFV